MLHYSPRSSFTSLEYAFCTWRGPRPSSSSMKRISRTWIPDPFSLSSRQSPSRLGGAAAFSPGRPGLSVPALEDAAGLRRDGVENPLPDDPRFNHEYDFLVPNIRPDNILLVAIRAVSTDCWCCCASLAFESTIFLASFLDTPFLSRPGAFSPRGVEAPDPGSTDSARFPAFSPRMAFSLRLARFLDRVSSFDMSFSMSKRYFSGRDLDDGCSVAECGPRDTC